MIIVWSDGGVHANGKATSSGYGSFLVDGEDEIHRLVFTEWCTNNITEYKTLISAMEYVKDISDDVEFRVDSQLVERQVSGRYACNLSHLVPLRDRVRDLLKQPDRRLTWVGRDEIVRKLGH